MSKLAGVLLIALLLPWHGRAEEPPPAKFYKLDFVIQEVDGAKVVNSREYYVLGGEGTGCTIRASSEVSLSTSMGTSTQVRNYEVGVRIDASHIKEVESGLTLTVLSDVSSLPSDLQPNGSPVVRKNSWNATVLVPMRRASVIFSSDDVSSKHKMQMVLTATLIK